MFGSKKRRIIQQADNIVSMMEDMDSLAWGRVLTIAKKLGDNPTPAQTKKLAEELAVIAQTNLSMFSRMNVMPMAVQSYALTAPKDGEAPPVVEMPAPRTFTMPPVEYTEGDALKADIAALKAAETEDLRRMTAAPGAVSTAPAQAAAQKAGLENTGALSGKTEDSAQGATSASVPDMPGKTATPDLQPVTLAGPTPEERLAAATAHITEMGSVDTITFARDDYTAIHKRLGVNEAYHVTLPSGVEVIEGGLVEDVLEHPEKAQEPLKPVSPAPEYRVDIELADALQEDFDVVVGGARSWTFNHKQEVAAEKEERRRIKRMELKMKSATHAAPKRVEAPLDLNRDMAEKREEAAKAVMPPVVDVTPEPKENMESQATMPPVVDVTPEVSVTMPPVVDVTPQDKTSVILPPVVDVTPEVPAQAAVSPVVNVAPEAQPQASMPSSAESMPKAQAQAVMPMVEDVASQTEAQAGMPPIEDVSPQGKTSVVAPGKTDSAPEKAYSAPESSEPVVQDQATETKMPTGETPVPEKPVVAETEKHASSDEPATGASSPAFVQDAAQTGRIPRIVRQEDGSLATEATEAMEAAKVSEKSAAKPHKSSWLERLGLGRKHGKQAPEKEVRLLTAEVSQSEAAGTSLKMAPSDAVRIMVAGSKAAFEQAKGSRRPLTASTSCNQSAKTLAHVVTAEGLTAMREAAAALQAKRANPTGSVVCIAPRKVLDAASVITAGYSRLGENERTFVCMITPQTLHQRRELKERRANPTGSVVCIAPEKLVEALEVHFASRPPLTESPQAPVCLTTSQTLRQRRELEERRANPTGSVACIATKKPSETVFVNRPLRLALPESPQAIVSLCTAQTLRQRREQMERRANPTGSVVCIAPEKPVEALEVHFASRPPLTESPQAPVSLCTAQTLRQRREQMERRANPTGSVVCVVPGTSRKACYRNRPLTASAAEETRVHVSVYASSGLQLLQEQLSYEARSEELKPRGLGAWFARRKERKAAKAQPQASAPQAAKTSKASKVTQTAEASKTQASSTSKPSQTQTPEAATLAAPQAPAPESPKAPEVSEVPKALETSQVPAASRLSETPLASGQESPKESSAASAPAPTTVSACAPDDADAQSRDKEAEASRRMLAFISGLQSETAADQESLRRTEEARRVQAAKAKEGLSLDISSLGTPQGKHTFLEKRPAVHEVPVELSKKDPATLTPARRRRKRKPGSPEASSARSQRPKGAPRKKNAPSHAPKEEDAENHVGKSGNASRNNPTGRHTKSPEPSAVASSEDIQAQTKPASPKVTAPSSVNKEDFSDAAPQPAKPEVAVRPADIPSISVSKEARPENEEANEVFRSKKPQTSKPEDKGTGRHGKKPGRHTRFEDPEQDDEVEGLHGKKPAHSKDFATFKHFYESRDGEFNVFEDEDGHLVSVKTSRLK